MGYGNGNPTDFFALNNHVEDNNRKQYFRFDKKSGGVTLRYNNYYLYSSLNNSQKFQSGTQSSNALVLMPYTESKTTVSVPVEENGFLVTNTPLEKETSVSVEKNWVIPPDMNSSVYEEEQIKVRLFANGADTGRTVTLNLKNDWKAVFRGMPYEDADGKEIVYTVMEIQNSDKWIDSYSDIVSTGTSPPNYTITVTNTYRTGGPLLPSTGSAARMFCMLLGIGIMLCPLIYVIISKYKKERRTKKYFIP